MIEPDVSLALHPGDWFRTTIVEPYRVDLAYLADHLGLSREAASAVLHGREPLTSLAAIRLEQAFGVSSELLIRMQEEFDLTQGGAEIRSQCAAAITDNSVEEPGPRSDGASG